MMEKEIMKKNTFIVAEISANHGHNIEIAKQSILLAKNAGADAVKIQTYTPDTITIPCDKEPFRLEHGTIWDGMNLYELYQQAYTPYEWHKALFQYAKEIDVILFSTPFDLTAVDLLEQCGNPIYKIASFEIADIPLIEYAAAKGKPMILSTGIATLEEIEEAVETCRNVGNEDITLLKCTSEYPAQIKDANLAMLQDMKKRFGVKVGLSDHTIGSFVPTVAVSLGATVVEKHFIMDKSIGGPDASFSMTPSEFQEMVQNIRNVEQAMGVVSYELTEKKINSRKLGRSLFVVKDIQEGEEFTNENIRSIRPGTGLPPKYIHEIIGKKATESLTFGTPMKWAYVANKIK